MCSRAAFVYRIMKEFLTLLLQKRINSFCVQSGRNNCSWSRFYQVINENLMKAVSDKDEQKAKVVKERLIAMSQWPR